MEQQEKIEETREAVILLTKDSSPEGATPEGKKKYYDGIINNRLAIMVKLQGLKPRLLHRGIQTVNNFLWQKCSKEFGRNCPSLVTFQSCHQVSVQIIMYNRMSDTIKNKVVIIFVLMNLAVSLFNTTCNQRTDMFLRNDSIFFQLIIKPRIRHSAATRRNAKPCFS